ncbi:MAG: hypothetical protein JNL11_03715 [Bdellovibrionaceae bacterium]|nr:hypothetical protein [Pseudobdellovibrionaceae bacterium]
MKSMNFLEFQAGVEKIRAAIVGAQLQDFLIQGTDLLLQFYARKSRVLRLSFKTPPVLFFEDENFKLEKTKDRIPLTLFLAKHFLRKSVLEVRYKKDWGRRFEIHLHNDEGGVLWMEVVMVPGYQNVGLFIRENHKEKKVYWNKPKELSVSTGESKVEVSDFRSLEGLRDEWYEQWRKNPSNDAGENVADTWKLDIRKKIQKKTNAIEKIKQQSIENDATVNRLYRIGEFAKYKAMGELDKNDQDWLNGIAKDMDRESIFKKAKALAAKSEGIGGRLQVLQDEILALENTLKGERPELQHKISIAGSADIATRKLEVGVGFSLYMGKNARDNVQLLKSSQPWELWFHLKDYPSAYAITRKNKTTAVEHVHLMKMASWFAKECFKNNKEKAPKHIDVIYTECRYVKLLKGDKLGRVTYANIKNLRVLLD